MSYANNEDNSNSHKQEEGVLDLQKSRVTRTMGIRGAKDGRPKLNDDFKIHNVSLKISRMPSCVDVRAKKLAFLLPR